MFVREEAGDHIVLAIIVEHIGHIVPLLEHEARARQVVGPGPCLLGPRLMAVEPLSEEEQSESRHLVVDRLVRTLMDDESVHAARHFEVGRMFQIARIEAISPVGIAIDRHRLTSHIFFSVEMRHGGRLADVAHAHKRGRVVRFLFLLYHPHGRHGNIRLAFGRHTVDEVQTAILVRLKIRLHAMPSRYLRCVLIHTLLDEFADGGAPVEEELLALLRAAHHNAREHRHPRQEAVAPSGLKLLHHARHPRLVARLIAVDEQVLRQPSACRPAVQLDIMFEEISESLAVNF